MCVDTVETQSGNDYDSPWKEALERYFSQFMALLFPQAHADIDWTLPHEFLDTELQQIVRDAESGRKHTDKLIKVFTRDGAEIWVLIHIEIQGRADRHFNARMYRYYYRLQDRHPNRQIASFALLTNQRGGKTIGHYQQSLWHTLCDFKFPVIKLQDWNDKLEQLENHTNPFALVILAQLMAHRTVQDNLARKASKFQLIRLLYMRGYEKQEVLELFRFIDWMLQLPKELELQLAYEIEQLEEQTMPYITSIERYATENGIQIGEARGEARGVTLGEARGVVLGEAQTLLKLFKLKFGAIPEWVEQKVNSADKVQLDVWVEGILPAQSIECLFSGQNQTVDNLQKNK